MSPWQQLLRLSIVSINGCWREFLFADYKGALWYYYDYELIKYDSLVLQKIMIAAVLNLPNVIRSATITKVQVFNRVVQHYVVPKTCLDHQVSCQSFLCMSSSQRLWCSFSIFLLYFSVVEAIMLERALFIIVQLFYLRNNC